MTARVAAVHLAARHRFSKEPVDAVTLRAGLGVLGDAHFGATVQHRSRKRWTPQAPNLRQVHLVAMELLDELTQRGFDVRPGSIGENITTRGIALLDLPAGARLDLGAEAAIEITGLRNPCVQLDRYQDGLMRAVLDRDPSGGLIRRAGVMAVVLRDGVVRPDYPIAVRLQDGPHRRLEPV